MQTDVLVDKATYGPCSTVGGPLSLSGNSLRGKLLSWLESAVAAWLCLSLINLAVVCQYLAFILWISIY